MTVPSTSKPRLRLVSVSTAAEFLGCHPRTVRRWIAAGEITAYRVGTTITLRVDMNELEDRLRPVVTAKPR